MQAGAAAVRCPFRAAEAAKRPRANSTREVKHQGVPGECKLRTDVRYKITESLFRTLVAMNAGLANVYACASSSSLDVATNDDAR